MRLFLVVSVDGVVSGEVETTALLALQSPAGDEVADVDHVTQFTDVLRSLDALEEALGLFVEHIETIPCSVQTQVTANDADIVGHNLVHLLHGLRDEHLLLVGHRAIVVPLRHFLVEIVEVNVLQRVLGGSVGIDDGLDE